MSVARKALEALSCVAVKTQSAPGIDVADFIDQHPIGGFQIRILLMCFAVLFVDGYDTQAIGYIAPAL